MTELNTTKNREILEWARNQFPEQEAVRYATAFTEAEINIDREWQQRHAQEIAERELERLGRLLAKRRQALKEYRKSAEAKKLRNRIGTLEKSRERWRQKFEEYQEQVRRSVSTDDPLYNIGWRDGYRAGRMSR